MATEPADGVADILTLRFEGEDADGTKLHELRASHVAEVLQGLVGLTSDFAKAGAFGDGPGGSEVLVRPAQQGSFLIEVVRFAIDNQDSIKVVAGVTGPPTIGKIIWWATKSARANIKDVSNLDNGEVKIVWQDDTVDVVPDPVWRELKVRNPRRKRQLRQIMAPLSDPRVSSLDVKSPPAAGEIEVAEVEGGELEAVDEPKAFTLKRPDYDAVRPDDEETEERQDVFETEAQMSAVDFDRPTKWRVTARGKTRSATVEDAEFLGRIANGLAVRKTDIFRLRVREDLVEKNGRTTRTWTVLKVESFRRAAHDDDA